MTPLSGTIYVISDGTHIKVGWTSVPVNWWLTQLQTGNVLQLTALASVSADNSSDEALLHSYLQERGLHVRGEWFQSCQPLIDAFLKNRDIDGVLNTLGLQRPEVAESVGTRLATLRRMAGGLSQRETASLAGLKSKSHVGTIEAGQQGMKGDTACRLADLFGVSLSWLLRGSGAPPDEMAVQAAVTRAISPTPQPEPAE